MATHLVYLEDFAVVTCAAKVTAVSKTEDGRVDIQLDATCFYPRGGGQDWDTGIIYSEDRATVFDVEEVRLDEEGVVHHIGAYRSGELRAGEAVTGEVDVDRRMVNTRLHSAGHVVDLAVDRLQLPWTPGRGAHYPHMSFVEYEGTASPEEAEHIRSQIETLARDVIAAGGTNEIRFMPAADMHTVCRHVPENIPTNKPARVVIYCDDFGVPCGGTHVRDLHDIGTIHITKVKTKKGLTKVSYTIEGIN